MYLVSLNGLKVIKNFINKCALNILNWGLLDENKLHFVSKCNFCIKMQNLSSIVIGNIIEYLFFYKFAEQTIQFFRTI